MLHDSALYKFMIEIDIVVTQVSVPDETRYSIFIPRSIASDRARIIQLLSATCGRDDSVFSAAAVDNPAGSTASSSYSAGGLEDGSGGSGYLVLVRAGKSKDDGNGDGAAVWRGKEVKIDLTGDTAIAVSHMEVVSLQSAVENMFAS